MKAAGQADKGTVPPVGGLAAAPRAVAEVARQVAAGFAAEDSSSQRWLVPAEMQAQSWKQVCVCMGGSVTDGALADGLFQGVSYAWVSCHAQAGAVMSFLHLSKLADIAKASRAPLLARRPVGPHHAPARRLRCSPRGQPVAAWAARTTPPAPSTLRGQT